MLRWILFVNPLIIRTFDSDADAYKYEKNLFAGLNSSIDSGNKLGTLNLNATHLPTIELFSYIIKIAVGYEWQVLLSKTECDEKSSTWTTVLISDEWWFCYVFKAQVQERPPWLRGKKFENIRIADVYFCILLRLRAFPICDELNFDKYTLGLYCIYLLLVCRRCNGTRHTLCQPEPCGCWIYCCERYSREAHLHTTNIRAECLGNVMWHY